MKIQCATITFIFVFLITGNNEASSQQTNKDSVSVTTIKATFLRRTMDEYCGEIHLPEKNKFEMTKWENGEFVIKSFEIESNTGCKGGANFIPGKTYAFSMLKIGDKILYRNIKTEPPRRNLHWKKKRPNS